MSTVTYALITSAKNEELYLERTICSVLAQTIRPVTWVIVDDGSGDRTPVIAEAYARRNPWITLVRRRGGASRSFASKATSFAVGYGRLKEVSFEYLGNLDADISFEPDYYERLFDLFEKDVSLGIAGGRFYDVGANGRLRAVTNSPDSVRGAVQMFRRRCYQDVGGYLSLPMGGIDSAAEIMARMKGWKVRTFANIIVLHLRPTGSGMGSSLEALVRRGLQDHSLGYAGMFEAARCWARMKEWPYVIASLAVLLGYCWAWLRGKPPALPAEAVSFLRREQRFKLIRGMRRTSSGPGGE
jgi:glycosyltransferase involved in cell wall biosynthesis